MLERLLILIAFTLLALAALQAWRWLGRRRLRQIQAKSLPQPLGDLGLKSRPAILYFTTPTCTQCRYQQTPILQELAKTWQGKVEIRKLDASEHDELARHFGVMTAPTTVVLDCEQNVAAINHGLAPPDRLLGQVTALLERHSAARCAHGLAAQIA